MSNRMGTLFHYLWQTAFRAIVLACAAAVLPLCSNNPANIAGGGTGGGNPGISGALVYDDSRPAANAVVFLRPNGFLPNVTAKVGGFHSLRTLDSTFTDSLGNFVFDSIAAGTYNLECLDGEDGNGALIDSVVVTHPDSTVELATDTLKPLGSIAGQVQLPESLDASQVRVMVYGLSRVVTPDSAGKFVLPYLAQGTYSLRFNALSGSAKGFDLRGAEVISGDTTLVPSVAWPDSGLPAIACTFIQFDDIMPAGFSLDQCWGGVGIDQNQNIYVGISKINSSAAFDSTADVGIFTYNAQTGQKKFLNTLKGISSVAGNLGPNQFWPRGESMSLINSTILEHNGKMYFASHDYQGIQPDYSDTLEHRGGHFFSYDPATGEFDDLSKNEPFGVSVRYQTIVATNVLRSQNKLAGYTFPWGDILIHDLADNTTAVYSAPAESRIVGNLTSRKIIAGKNGKVFFSYNSQTAAVVPAPLWQLDVATGAITKTANMLHDGFIHGLVETRDGRFVYLSNIDGYLHAFDTETETLEQLGFCVPDSQLALGYSPTRVFSLGISQDETKLYSLVPSWTTSVGIPYSLYEYDIPTKAKRYLGNFADILAGSTITGDGVTDNLGRMYFARMNGDTTTGLIQISITSTAGTASARRANRQTTAKSTE